MEKEYYIVELCTGNMSDYGYKTLFITDKEYKAKFYVSRANDIIKRYAEYYEYKFTTFNQDDYEDLDWYETWKVYHNRSEFTAGTFMYTPAKLKANIKLPQPPNPLTA